jgi:hypothetical protein
MTSDKKWKKIKVLNWKAGLFRLWVIFSVLWCSFFSLVSALCYLEDIERANTHLQSSELELGMFDDLIPKTLASEQERPITENIFFDLIPTNSLLERAKIALVNADKAGDVEAARALANYIREFQSSTTPQVEPVQDNTTPLTEAEEIELRQLEAEFGLFRSDSVQTPAISAPRRIVFVPPSGVTIKNFFAAFFFPMIFLVGAKLIFYTLGWVWKGFKP